MQQRETSDHALFTVLSAMLEALLSAANHNKDNIEFCRALNKRLRSGRNLRAPTG